MHFSALFISLFGMFGLARGIRILFSAAVIEKKYQTLSIIFFFGIQLLFDFFFFKFIFSLLFFNLGVFLISPMIMQVKEHLAWKNHDQNVLNLLDSLIVIISSGGSLKQALLQIQPPKNHFKHLVNEIKHVILMNSNVKMANFRPDTEKIASELRKIDQSGFKTLEKVKNLRQQLRTKIHFRQKMSQATLQIRWQSLIVSLLYCALVCFAYFNFGWNQIQGWFLVSFLLFGAGLICNLFVERSFKWKT
jgi:hypothetical protein